LGGRGIRKKEGHLKQREAALARARYERCRQPLVPEPRPKAESRDPMVGEVIDQRALAARILQLEAGRQQQLAAAQPRRRVLELGAVHPADVRLRRLVTACELEAELGDQAFDGELHDAIRSLASLSTGRSTATISSNCSGPAISGGDSCTIGSPRSSVRQISPRRNSSPDRKPRSSVSASSSSN